ncbi:MAG: aspartate-semialdehyde dehydrogenase [Phycisphaerae bacterium]|jgi:aspartate-semialdehyde dehydrogenase|nr:aspartate-semialdehyde dehydrogenase [Phycisphaerae bacterium]
MSVNVAVVGATGAVGKEFVKILEQRKFPYTNIKFLASARSAGKEIKFDGKTYIIEELTEKSFAGIDVALFSAGGSISKQFALAAVKAGAVVVDNSSAFRMDPNVPLIVPEVNPEDIAKHQGIIANPNCSTIIMVVPVFALHKVNKIKRILASTYQAASGAGWKAMKELEDQTRDVLDGKQVKPEVMPYQYAFNLFSHNSKIGPNGYNEEEIKMVSETRKMFHDESIMISATCVRVPILRAHSEAITLEFTNDISEQEVREILAKAPGVTLVDDREKNFFPMPLDASNQGNVLAGRIRRDTSLAGNKGICLFVAGDQLLKGAALNTVQIAELLPNVKGKGCGCCGCK